MASSAAGARLRIWVYLLSMILHTGNLVFIAYVGRDSEGSTNPDIVAFHDVRFRFFTTWTFMLQIAYSIFSIVCDVISLRNANKKDFALPTIIIEVREFFFSSLVWPCSVLVFSFFWSLYIYDRSLIFPEYLDEIIPPISNHIMHTLILPIVLAEVWTRPRSEPETHARNVMQLTMHMVVYLCVMLFTNYEKGIWLYPIFKKLEGTIYFWLVIAFVAIFTYIYYYIQWPLTKLIHGKSGKSAKKVKMAAGMKKNR